MDVKQKLKNRRKELGLTMLEVAQKVGVSEATVSRWESGDIANMRRDKITLLANALNVQPSFIMDWEGNPDEEPTSPDNKLTSKETTILNKYNLLNNLGQEKAEGYIDDLLENKKYTEKSSDKEKKTSVSKKTAAPGKKKKEEERPAFFMAARSRDRKNPSPRRELTPEEIARFEKLLESGEGITDIKDL